MSLSLPPSTKIYLALAPCDMRKGFDGLAAQVKHVLELDPYSGAAFFFRGEPAEGAGLGRLRPLPLCETVGRPEV